MRGSVTRRCGCTEVGPDGKRRQLGSACPKLGTKGHGTWGYLAETPAGANGKRRQQRRSGFTTKAEAEAALTTVLEAVKTGQHAHDGRMTVEAFLRDWLEGKVAGGLRPTTARGYRAHVDLYLVPHLGRHRLGNLRPTHVDRMLRDIATDPANHAGPATVRRIHATLRSAMSTAKSHRLISYNPAAELALPKVPRPVVRPWEPDELGAFLDHAAADPLGSMFELIAMTGLRRGEACGLRWVDVDLQRRALTVRQQVVQLGHEVIVGPPKTAGSKDRLVDLDEQTVGTLLAHRLEQDERRAAWGSAWVDSGLVFAREDGSGWHPDYVSAQFGRLIRTAGLRQVRLHDLRHGQASLMLAAGVPLAVVSKRLGHSSVSLTADTYSHLLEGVGRQAAEAASGLVKRNRPQRDHTATTPPVAGASEQHGAGIPAGQTPADSGAGGARTHDRRIMSPLL